MPRFFRQGKEEKRRPVKASVPFLRRVSLVFSDKKSGRLLQDDRFLFFGGNFALVSVEFE